jgi:hypothetical protein
VSNLADLMIGLGVDPSGVEEGMSKGKKLAAAGGAAIAAAAGTALFKAMDVSAANDKLAAQLGLSADESKRIGGVAGDLYANAYGESIEDVNVAVGAVMSSIEGMNKASSADLQSVTATALDFATTFDVDVQRAVDVAGRAISSGLAPDAETAFDLITAASQKVPANLREDVLDAVDEYGQFFATVGIDGPNAFGMLVDGASKGMFGIDKLGDAIKEFTILSTDGSESTQDAYKSMGLNAKEMQKSILSGGDSAAKATDKIVDGLLGIKDPGKQAQTALALFGTPIEDLNVKDIPEFLKTLSAGSDSLGDFAGSAADMGATLNDNATTNLTTFKRQVEQGLTKAVSGAIPYVESAARVAATVLGPALGGIAETLGSTVVPALKATAGFVRENQTTFTVIAAVIAALFIPRMVLAAATATRTAAQTVAAWVSQQVAATRSAIAQAGAFARMIANWVRMAVVSTAQAARVAAAWLISMGPIAIVIAAIVGLVAVVVKNWDTIKKATKVAFEWVWNKVKTVFDWMKKLFLNFTGPGLIIKHFDKIVGFVKDLPGRIASAATGMWDGIKDAFRSALNWLIGAWNGLEFTTPKISIPFAPDIPSITFGVPDIPMLADGGPLRAGQMAIVGERGPELFVPSASGRVVPNDAMGSGEPAEWHIYLGDREITDLVDVRIRERDRGTKKARQAGARRAFA